MVYTETTECWEGTDIIWMERIQGANGANLVQSDCTSINYYIYDSSGEEVSSGTLTISSVIFNTLQTGAPWTEDSTGYNFKWQISGALLPNAIITTTYLVEVIILTSASGIVPLRRKFKRVNLSSRT